MLVASFALFLLAIQPAITQQPVTIRILIQALEAARWQELLVPEFEAQNPDINLEIVEAPNNSNQVEDLYTSAFLLGDSPYDLVYMDVVWTPKFAAAGWLRDLSDYTAEAELADFLDSNIQAGRYQGQLYRIPLRSDAGMLYYRTDLLDQIGADPPETFDQLLALSRRIQEQDLTEWGYLWQGKQYEGLSAMFVEILAGYGAFWIDPETLEVGLDAPEAIAAVEFLRTTIEEEISPPGVTTYDEDPTRRLFQSGESAFLRNWPYVYRLAADSPIAGRYGIKPMVHAPGHSSGACLGGWGLGISKTSRHPDEAWRVIEFFSAPEIQKRYILETGYVPAQRSLFGDPDLLARYSYLPELLEVLQNTVLRPPIAQYSQASDILQRYLSAALSGSLSPEAAMQAAARETRTLLKRS